jgi:Autotransporter beta-domain
VAPQPWQRCRGFGGAGPGGRRWQPTGNRLAIAAAGNANAIGAPIGSTGFTTGQAVPSGAALAQTVKAITPESYAAFQSVGLNALRQQRQTLIAQAGGCRETGWVVTRPTTTPVCLFATGGRATASIAAGDGLSGCDTALSGGFYGIEVQPSRRWTLGAGSNSVSAPINSGSLYGVYRPEGAWTVKGVVGNGNPITGRTTANGTTAGLQGDYAIPLSKPTATVPITLKPQLGAAYGAYQQEGFSDSGDPAMDLTVAGHTSRSLVGTLGAELMAAIPLNPDRSALLRPRFAVADQVDALADGNGNRSLNASLPGAGVSFSSAGRNRGLNDLTLSGSLEVVIASKASLYVSASKEAFSTGRQFAYGGGVKLSF